MDRSDVDFEFAKQFWTTANVVTGFSIAQLVAFSLAAAAAAPTTPKVLPGPLDCEIQQHPVVTGAAVTIAAVVYIALVWFCQSASKNIMARLPKSLATMRLLGAFDKLRIAATVFAGVASIALVLSIVFPGWASHARAGTPAPRYCQRSL